ncbi:unnamed protein product [Cochlearia groenlandica]
MASRVFGARSLLMAKSADASSSSSSVVSAALLKISKLRNGTLVTSVREGKGILKVVPVSKPLAKFIGEDEVARTTAVKKIWDYIKLNNLQNTENKREIRCDSKLKTIFNGKDTVGLLEIAKLLSQHFPKSA